MLLYSRDETLESGWLMWTCIEPVEMTVWLSSASKRTVKLFLPCTPGFLGLGSKSTEHWSSCEPIANVSRCGHRVFQKSTPATAVPDSRVQRIRLVCPRLPKRRRGIETTFCRVLTTNSLWRNFTTEYLATSEGR